MKPILLALGAGLAVVASLALTSPALAQQNDGGSLDPPPAPAPELLVAPQHQPQEGVRLAPLSEQFVPLPPQKKPLTMVNYVAMQRAAERRARLEAQAWYGFSPSRPAVYLTPYGGFATAYEGSFYAPYQASVNYYAPTIVYPSGP
jgi:hypothetical protein